jgi:hypothetical protein
MGSCTGSVYPFYAASRSPHALVLLRRSVLASTVGKRQMRCAAPCRSAACRSITRAWKALCEKACGGPPVPWSLIAMGRIYGKTIALDVTRYGKSWRFDRMSAFATISSALTPGADILVAVPDFRL